MSPEELNRNEVTQYSIGPYAVNLEAGTVTLAPGVYTLQKPIVFSLHESTLITGVYYKPLTDLMPPSAAERTETTGAAPPRN